MKMGIIDMGTNTFHLVIVDHSGDHFDFLYRDRRSVRLGKGGISKGLITPEGMERALQTMTEFKEILEDHGITEVHATATSAVRNAKNGEELTQQIAAKTGIKVRVITGLEEAEYIYFGVSQALDIGKAPALIMDIGGGSIEFIIGTSSEILWKESFEIGGQRLLDLFHQHDPITTQEISNIHQFLEEKLTLLFEQAAKYRPQTLIGSSGTFDTLSDIYLEASKGSKPEGATEYPLDYDSFLEIHDQLVTKTREKRLQIPGMIEMRVDMIVVASILLKFLIEKLAIKNLRVSAFALKEGVMLSHLNGKNAFTS